jgi:sugar lactone lactonase YvrE/enterochelin esterase-like enzyme
LLQLACALCLPADDEYPEHPDSVVQDGVPQGKVEGPFEWRSEIYPGTVRNYWIYVPAQYDETKPACVMVVQDGLGRANEWKLPTVLDNLIHQGDVPVTVGIFIDHGVVPAPHDQAQPRFNRSFEYDAMGDRYARFLIEEILPEVSKSYNLSDDPNDRCIAGASSGAICAFTVAWERPDEFRRVLSTIGTYVGLRAGNEYPVLVRKCENRPMRVYLQDGTNDLDIYAGSWWVANQDMLAALQYAGYDVEYAWGEGGHNGRHGTAIMPDALRWLWRDYPEPIVPGRAQERRTDVLIEGENWELLSEGHGFTEGPAVSPSGEVFFTDGSNGMIHRIALDGTVTPFVEGEQGVNGLMFGPDGFLYCCHSGARQIVRFDAEGNKEVIIEDAPCNDLTLLHDGTGYYTDPENKKVWWFTSAGDRRVVDEGIEFANGVITSTDQTLLFVADTRGRFVYSYQIQPGGDLAYKQEYGHLHRPDDTGETGADGMTVDTEGRLYVATSMGVQILDQLGRVNFIIDKPQRAWLANIVFGGEGNQWLYATCHDKVFRRRLNATGAIPFQPPRLPPRPGL